MIVVKIELWPLGREKLSREIGRLHISNDMTGTKTRGNYNVRAFRRGSSKVWKTGRIENFPRKSLAQYDIVYRALKGLVGSRNNGGRNTDTTTLQSSL